MKTKLIPIFSMLCAAISVTSPAIAGISGTTPPVAWVQLDSSKVQHKERGVHFGADTILYSSAICGSQSSQDTCENIKLEATPFDSNGKLYVDIANTKCSALFEVPFTVRKDALETPIASYTAKWESGDQSSCPATKPTLTVSRVANASDAYLMKVVEN